MTGNCSPWIAFSLLTEVEAPQVFWSTCINFRGGIRCVSTSDCLDPSQLSLSGAHPSSAVLRAHVRHTRGMSGLKIKEAADGGKENGEGN